MADPDERSQGDAEDQHAQPGRQRVRAPTVAAEHFDRDGDHRQRDPDKDEPGEILSEPLPDVLAPVHVASVAAISSGAPSANG